MTLGDNFQQPEEACTEPHGRFSRVLLLFLLSGDMACKDDHPAANASAADARSFDSAPDQDRGAIMARVPGISDTRLYKYAGTMDVKNLYAFTVMVTLGDPEMEPDCSGVLLNSRLVLTAAHCVCPQQNLNPSGAPRGSAFTGSSCSERASVTTVLYGATLSENYKEESTHKRYRLYEGTVRPHPEFQSLRDDKGSVLQARANLATILLDDPVQDSVLPVTLSSTEAQAGEFLLMAGYASKGQDDLGGLYGIRYFQKNKVTRVPATDSSQVLYEHQGPSLYNGYPGGPCFREVDGRRWLVGIASTGASHELSCTSTHAFKSWLQAEIQHAALQTPRSPLEPGNGRSQG